MKRNIATSPHTHPAIVEERRAMLEKRRQEMLAPRRTYAAPERVEFNSTPMHRPPLDVRRDLPQSPARPGAMDAFSLPSRGFA